VLPSLTNAIAFYRYPINQTRLSNAIRRIQLNESKEGLYKVVSAYYKQYPQFNDGDTSLQNMYKKGYAMAGQMGDQKAKPQIDQYYHQIKNRDRWASGFNFISPAVQAQQLFNYLSCTDVTNYLNYQREVGDFHSQLVKFYVEPFLLNQQFTFQSYARKPAFQWMPSIDFSRVWSGISLLLLWCIVLFSPAYILLKKNN
jgi:ABC-2 type transport system permease protein